MNAVPILLDALQSVYDFFLLLVDFVLNYIFSPISSLISRIPDIGTLINNILSFVGLDTSISLLTFLLTPLTILVIALLRYVR